MNSQEQALVNNAFAMEELTKYHQENINSEDITNPKGTLITSINQDIVRFNGYYPLDITAGKDKGNKGAFFTIDTNMYVTTDGNISTAKYYLQFILSMDGKSSVVIPFTGTFTKLGSGDYELHQKATGVGGLNEVTLNLTFSRSQANTTVTFNGKISIAAPGYGTSNVNGATYNNPILSETYLGTYYDKDQNKTLEICEDYKLSYRCTNTNNLQRIEAYKFNLNMYVFSFTSPSDGSAMVSLVMGTSPASGLVCGDLTTIKGIPPKQRTLNTIKQPETVPKPASINMNSNQLAPFSAYYPTPTPDNLGAFIAIQATRIPVIGKLDMFEVMIGVSVDGKTSTVYNFDDSMSFEGDTLKIPNPNYFTENEAKGNALPSTQPEYIVDVSFVRHYVKNGMSGYLIKLEGQVMGNAVTAYTPFNLIPLKGFEGATLTNSNGETLVVNSNDDITYKGYNVGSLQSLLYVPIMYILVFTNPEPHNSEALGLEYKVVCSFGTDGEQGLACIVTEYTLKDNVVVDQSISYYHSVPKQT